MTMTKFLSTALYTLFVLLLLSVAGLFLASLLPIPGTIEVKIVKSGSMEPAILTGSIVVVMPEKTYAVGDIVTFGVDTRREIPTTHRIVAIQSENGRSYIQTKGDANEEADPKLTPMSDVIGKVVVAVPYAGYILDFARQPIGFTLMIGIPAGIIILDELFRIYNEIVKIRRDRRKKNRILELRRMPSYYE